MTLRQLCNRGHKLVPLNTVIEHAKDRVVRRCLECRWASEQAKLKRARRDPSKNLTCRSGRHAWVADNWVVGQRDDGTIWRTCRLCRREQGARKLPTYTRIGCLGLACSRGTWRKDPKPGSTYLCPTHRKNPPTWIRSAGLRIVGTEVKAA